MEYLNELERQQYAVALLNIYVQLGQTWMDAIANWAQVLDVHGLILELIRKVKENAENDTETIS